MLLVGGTFALVAGALALWTYANAPVDEAPEMTPIARALAPVRLRCETCGVIESIVRTEATGGVAASYEFAVRLPDGSLRHSSDPLRGRWQVGEGMQLIGGDRTWSAPTHGAPSHGT
jgi:hypothetical protein